MDSDNGKPKKYATNSLVMFGNKIIHQIIANDPDFEKKCNRLYISFLSGSAVFAIRCRSHKMYVQIWVAIISRWKTHIL